MSLILSEEQLDAALYLPVGGEVADGVTFVAKQYEGTSRWTVDYLIVVQDWDGQLWGYGYNEPATEMQDGDYAWESNVRTEEGFEGKPVEARTSVTYVEVKDQ